VGAILPAICTAGDQFFKSNAIPGQNLYACVATNSWAAQTSGSTTQQATAFTDLLVTGTDTVLTVGTGRADFSVNGLPQAINLGPATIVHSTGSDTGTFLVYADYNSGAPVLRCSFTVGINPGSYVVSNGFSGSTCTSGNAFPAHTIPLATMDVSGGIFQTPIDLRTALAREPLFASGGLTIAGNVVSLSSGVATGGVKRVAYALLPVCSPAELNVQYLFTDGDGISAQCDGTSVAYFYNNQPITLPGLLSTFTTVNATAGQTVADDKGGLYVHAQSTTAGSNLVTALKSLGTATDIQAGVVFGSPGADSNSCGLVLTDGTATTNKVTFFGRTAMSNSWTSQFVNYSDYATPDVAGPTQFAPASSGSLIWLRITISGMNQNFYVSGDGGATWELAGSQTAYETATQYGVGCDARGTVTPAAMYVVSLSAH
jgi:hypothetical protein